MRNGAPTPTAPVGAETNPKPLDTPPATSTGTASAWLRDFVLRRVEQHLRHFGYLSGGPDVPWTKPAIQPWPWCGDFEDGVFEESEWPPPARPRPTVRLPVLGIRRTEPEPDQTGGGLVKDGGSPVGGRTLMLPPAKRLCGATAAAGLRRHFTGAFWPLQPPAPAETLNNTLHLILSRMAGVRLRAPKRRAALSLPFDPTKSTYPAPQAPDRCTELLDGPPAAKRARFFADPGMWTRKGCANTLRIRMSSLTCPRLRAPKQGTVLEAPQHNPAKRQRLAGEFVPVIDQRRRLQERAHLRRASAVPQPLRALRRSPACARGWPHDFCSRGCLQCAPLST